MGEQMDEEMVWLIDGVEMRVHARRLGRTRMDQEAHPAAVEWGCGVWLMAGVEHLESGD